jgi:hypothetical protein
LLHLKKEVAMQRVACLASLAFLLSIGGCGSELPQGMPVSGTVSFQGAPLDHGSIEFAPVSDEGVFSGAPIVVGTYEIPDENGLTAGEYEVRISSSSGETATEEEAPGESSVTAKERIPAGYNVATTLKVTVQPSQDNTFDFQIP